MSPEEERKRLALCEQLNTEGFSLLNALERQRKLVHALEQLEQAREALRLLEVAACPANCDKGSIPHQVTEDEWEAEQCQFCYEREQALNQQGED